MVLPGCLMLQVQPVSLFLVRCHESGEREEDQNSALNLSHRTIVNEMSIIALTNTHEIRPPFIMCRTRNFHGEE